MRGFTAKSRRLAPLRALLRFATTWRGRVWLGALCLAVFPIVILTIAQSILQAREVAEFRGAQLERAAGDLAVRLDEHVASQRDQVRNIATDLKSADFDDQRAMAAAIVRSAEWAAGASSVAVVDTSGRIVAISRRSEDRTRYEPAPFRGAIVSDREYFSVPVRTGRTFVSRTYESRGAYAGQAAYFVSAPLERDGVVRGIVYAATLTSELQRFERRFASQLEAHVVMLDRAGRVMYASRDLGVRVMADAKGVPWISQLLARETAGDGSMPMGAKEPRRILYAHAATTEGWHVLVIRPQLSLGHIMGKFIAGAVPLLLLTLCVAIVIAHHLIAMLSRPLELLMKRIDTFDIDATEGHFRGFGELPSEYVAMMRRLHRMAWRLRAWHARLRAALADAKRARTEVISVLVNREDEVRARTRELAEANAALERLSRIDPLTEVANRRCFAEALEREWRAALRDSCALSVFLIDIDHYKAFNDRYGHQAGDDCLRQVAGALRLALFRPRDHLARYGGEEFAVIAAQLDVAGAALVGERIRTAVRALGVRHEASGPSGLLTVSIGAATVIPDPARSPEWLLRIADRALYAAKAAGRDRVAQAEADERLVVNEPEQVHVVSLSATG